MNNRRVFKEKLSENDLEKLKEKFPVYQKLRKIFERNLKEKGVFEISAIELAEATGKDVHKINRDIREEFTVVNSYMDIIDQNNDEAYYLIKGGEKKIGGEVFIETQKDSQGKDRDVYILRGSALSFLITRWDRITRLILVILIHIFTDSLSEYSLIPENVIELADYIGILTNLALRLTVEYNRLKNDTNLEHIKTNYDTILGMCKDTEVMINAARLGRVHSKELEKLYKELRNADRELVDVIGRQEEEAVFGEELSDTLRKSR